MAWSDFSDMFVDVCKDIGAERTNIVSQLTQKNAVIAELDVFAAGSPAKQAVMTQINADRAAYQAAAGRWQAKMNAALAYGGTQLTTPSAYVSADRVTDFRALMRDINAYMVANSLFVETRATTWASEPTADADGIIDRLTKDENAITIEGGLPATVDLEVISKPARYRSIYRVQGRQKGIDVFNLLGPAGFVDVEAVNGAGGTNLVNNGQLTGANSSTNAAAVTSLNDWTLSNQAGTPVHVIDTSIAYRGQSYSHKMYTNSTTRRFSQPLVVNPTQVYNPRNYMLAVYKTGTPVGTITVTWGSKSQAFTMGSLSSGWNYLRLDRDEDLFPINFDSGDSVLQIDFAFTSGSDASNYINFAFAGGQNLTRWNGVWWGHWSQNGISTLGDTKEIQDSQDGNGLNQNALYYAYHGTAFADFAYLNHSTGSPITIADYT